MKPNRSESPSDVMRWSQSQAAGFWPAVLGSLSLRRSPCVRKNCPACLSGEQHASYVLYGRLKGRRFAVYVPEELVPEVRRCLDNGRALQELLFQAAPRYVKALKRERDQASKKTEDGRVPRTVEAQIWYTHSEVPQHGIQFEPLPPSPPRLT